MSYTRRAFSCFGGRLTRSAILAQHPSRCNLDPGRRLGKLYACGSARRKRPHACLRLPINQVVPLSATSHFQTPRRLAIAVGARRRGLAPALALCSMPVSRHSTVIRSHGPGSIRFPCYASARLMRTDARQGMSQLPVSASRLGAAGQCLGRLAARDLSFYSPRASRTRTKT
jgi:hypothetical protein